MSASVISNAIPARRFSVREARQAKAAADRRTDSSRKWPSPESARRRLLASKTTTATTIAPAHTKTFKPQGVARNNPSPSTPSSNAASSTLKPCFVFSFISFSHQSRRTQFCPYRVTRDFRVNRLAQGSLSSSNLKRHRIFLLTIRAKDFTKQSRRSKKSCDGFKKKGA